MSDEPIKVFFSYSHRDEEFKDELVNHLSILQRQGVIDGWHDRLISPGSEWDREIDDYLNSADIILLLISADFLASNYCWGVEVKRALERHEAGEACVIPIVVRAVNWKNTPLAKLQALPKNAKPIRSWEDRDEAFTNVSEGIELAVNLLQDQRKKRMEHPPSVNSQPDEKIQPSRTQAVTKEVSSILKFPRDQLDAAFFFIRAFEKGKKGDYQGAIADYTQAIRLHPNYASAYYNRGLGRKEQGDKRSAIADFQKAANLYQQQGNSKCYQNALNRLNELQS